MHHSFLRASNVSSHPILMGPYGADIINIIAILGRKTVAWWEVK